MFNSIYKGRKVLVTGHTGFKGSWLALWLQQLGAEVVGIALPPTTSLNHWDALNLDMNAYELDIRNEDGLKAAIQEIQPDIIFHLAAQSLVRPSYKNPLETWSTNVMGTANVLDAARQIDALAAIVVVTTDKCYKNEEWVWGYRETDPLGGHDPYSASKAGSELVVDSFRHSFFNTPNSPLIASARAGNVVGGGDWSEDRLIPDLVRSVRTQSQLEIRSPNATRPWQHILECLSGYLLLGKTLLEGRRSHADAWNFGPGREANRPVREVLEAFNHHWQAVNTYTSGQTHVHEAQLLYLDSGKAHQHLNWRPVWSFEQGIQATVDWYRAFVEHNKIISLEQLEHYITVAKDQKLEWAGDSLLN